MSSRVSPEDTLVATIHGRYRTDGLYLFPVHLQFTEGVLLADFATHRKGFLLGEFSGKVPADLQDLPREGTTGLPSPDKVRSMVWREKTRGLNI